MLLDSMLDIIVQLTLIILLLHASFGKPATSLLCTTDKAQNAIAPL